MKKGTGPFFIFSYTGSLMKLFKKKLTILLIFPMLFNCVSVYADTVKQKPDAVDADSIRVNDVASGKKNKVTISWNQVSGASGYEVTVAEQGKSDSRNRYTEIQNGSAKNIYNGSNNKLSVKLKRFYEYRFRIRSYDASGNYSDWTDRYYFTAVTPEKSAHSSAVEIRKNLGGKNTTVKNNVIKLKRNVTVKKFGLGSTSDKVVIDLAGHELNVASSLDEFIVYGNNTVVIQDSVGGGVFNPKVEEQWIQCKNIVINGGTFSGKIFALQPLKTSIKGTVSIINAGHFKRDAEFAFEKAIVNGGTFDKTYETTQKKMIVNNGTFNEVESRADNVVINGGDFKNSVVVSGSKLNTINGGSYTQTLDFYSSNATVNGGEFIIPRDMNVTDIDDWKARWLDDTNEDGTLNLTNKVSWNEDRTAIIVG